MLTSILKKKIEDSFTKPQGPWEDTKSNISFKFDKSLSVAIAPDVKAGKSATGSKMVDLIIKGRYLIENKKTYKLAFNVGKMGKVNEKFMNAKEISKGSNVLVISSKITNDFKRVMKIRKFSAQSPDEINSRFQKIWSDKGLGTILIYQSKKISITNKSIKCVS